MLSSLIVAGGVALAGAAHAEVATGKPIEISVQQLVQQADADNAGAQLLLATMHLKGAVKDADPVKAATLLDRAAAKGNVPAKAMLAEMYLNGQGVAADPAQARRLLQQAADAGHPHSQFNLAVMLFTGKGGDRDPVQGVKWLALSSANGDAALREKADAKMKPVARIVSKTVLTEGLEAARQWMLLKH
jgi:TPR repeat protein